MSDAVVTFNGNSYHVPAWSVSILPDCKTVVFNSAQVLFFMIKHGVIVDIYYYDPKIIFARRFALSHCSHEKFNLASTLGSQNQKEFNKAYLLGGL